MLSFLQARQLPFNSTLCLGHQVTSQQVIDKGHQKPKVYVVFHGEKDVSSSPKYQPVSEFPTSEEK
jgi:hypothetical protein